MGWLFSYSLFLASNCFIYFTFGISILHIFYPYWTCFSLKCLVYSSLLSVRGFYLWIFCLTEWHGSYHQVYESIIKSCIRLTYISLQKWPYIWVICQTLSLMPVNTIVFLNYVQNIHKDKAIYKASHSITYRRFTVTLLYLQML